MFIGMESILLEKKSLVLGGSGGIGAAVAEGLARCGSEVYIHGGKDEKKLKALLQKITAFGGRAQGSLVEISELNDIDCFFAEGNRYDVVVCAFGPFVQAPLDAYSAQQWSRLCLLNLALPGYLASRSYQYMKDKNFGRFLFFGGSNTDALRGYQSNSAYAAAKYGLNSLVKSIALVGAPHNVAANVLCPGLVLTEYHDTMDKKNMLHRNLGLPLISTDEIAKFALSVLESNVLNGASIPLDRGVFVGTRGLV